MSAAVLAVVAVLLRDTPCAGCLLEVPSGLPSPAPLVVALHGDEGSPAKVAGAWSTVARELGVVLFAPRCPKSEGCQGSWWRWDGSTRWLDEQVAALGAHAAIDPERRYLTAWSGGASYASLHVPELAKTFAAFSFAGGGIASPGTACLTGAGGGCAPVHVLAGDRNPHFSLTERTKDALAACGHDVRWVLLEGTDHAGEWKAYARRTREIGEWLIAARRDCSPEPEPEPELERDSGTATATARERDSGTGPTKAAPVGSRGCVCSSSVDSRDAEWELSGLAGALLLLRKIRSQRARSRSNTFGATAVS